MVATRRGVRVCSPKKTNSDESSSIQATPSTGRRTRRDLIQTETPAPGEDIGNQPHETEEEALVSRQSKMPSRRCTRSSRLNSPHQPSTPVGSIHEADVSDMESNCSAMSDCEPPIVSNRKRSRQPRSVSQEQDGVSEVESCSSAVSESRAEQKTRRSTRVRKTPGRSSTSESDKGKHDAESCSSVITDSQRVTRSLRRTTCTRSSVKRLAEDVQLSDADSASDFPASASTTARVTRSTRRMALTEPIPMHLDEASESSQSPVPAGRRTRAAARKLSCDSEGFESGPNTPLTRNDHSRKGATATDSDTDPLELAFSPGSTRSRGTPCSSSPTGYGYGVQAGHATRVSVVLERFLARGEEPEERALALPAPMETSCQPGMVNEPSEDESLLNESKLENTVMADPDCTVLEEENTITLEDEDEGVTFADIGSNDDASEDAKVIKVGHQGSVAVSVPADGVLDETSDAAESESADKMVSCENVEIKSPAESQLSVNCSIVESKNCAKAQVVCEPEGHQQRELSKENEDGEKPLIQEMSPSTEHTLLPSGTVIMDKMATTSKDAAGGNENDEAMSIQVNSGQEQKVKVDPAFEQNVNDSIVVNKTAIISLLHRCEDEDQDDEEDCSGKEVEIDLGQVEERALHALQSPDTTESESADKLVSCENVEIKSPAESQVSVNCSIVGSENAAEAQVVCDPEVPARNQQRELSEENEDGEKPLTQEMSPSTEQQLPSCTVIMHKMATTSKAAAGGNESDEAMEVDDMAADTRPPKAEKQQEEMQGGASNTNAQQVDGSSEVLKQVQAESIQVNSSQEQKVKVDPALEQNANESIVVKKTAIISLLDSSEDEDQDGEEEWEEGGSGEEVEIDLGQVEERAGSSKMPDVAVDGLFMIDKRPGVDADEQYVKDGVDLAVEEGSEEEEDFVDEEGDDDDDEDAQMLYYSRNPKLKELSSRIDPGLRVKELGGLYINFDGSKSKPVSNSLKKTKEQKIQDEVMKKTVIGPEFEKQSAAPPYREGKRTLNAKRKEAKEKTTGDGWFNMKAPELTPELKADLKVLKMRGSRDPKRFYKKNDREGPPKYFQIGTVVDSPVDFYHSRIPKKQRKRTMVEELLADSEFRQQNKRKYQQIMAEKAAQAAGRCRKKKFHNK